MNKITPFIVIAIGIAATFLIWAAMPKPHYGLETLNRFIATGTTNTAVTCGSQNSVQVIPGSGSRIYGLFTNDSANNIYMCFASSCASSTGMRLNANGGSYELKFDNLYVGPITCAANTGSSTLDVIYNQ